MTKKISLCPDNLKSESLAEILGECIDHKYVLLRKSIKDEKIVGEIVIQEGVVVANVTETSLEILTILKARFGKNFSEKIKYSYLQIIEGYEN